MFSELSHLTVINSVFQSPPHLSHLSALFWQSSHSVCCEASCRRRPQTERGSSLPQSHIPQSASTRASTQRRSVYSSLFSFMPLLHLLLKREHFDASSQLSLPAGLFLYWSPMKQQQLYKAAFRESGLTLKDWWVCTLKTLEENDIWKCLSHQCSPIWCWRCGGGTKCYIKHPMPAAVWDIYRMLTEDI